MQTAMRQQNIAQEATSASAAPWAEPRCHSQRANA